MPGIAFFDGRQIPRFRLITATATNRSVST